MPKHGGKREGAGRHPLPPEQKARKIMVSLYSDEVEALKALGQGNLSAGIRAALEVVRKEKE